MAPGRGREGAPAQDTAEDSAAGLDEEASRHPPAGRSLVLDPGVFKAQVVSVWNSKHHRFRD